MNTWQATSAIRFWWQLLCLLPVAAAVSIAAALGRIDSAEYLGPALGLAGLIVFAVLMARSQVANTTLQLEGDHLVVERGAHSERYSLSAANVAFGRWAHGGAGTLGTIVEIRDGSRLLRVAATQDLLAGQTYTLVDGAKHDLATTTPGFAEAIAVTHSPFGGDSSATYRGAASTSPRRYVIPLRSNVMRGTVWTIASIYGALLGLGLVLAPTGGGLAVMVLAKAAGLVLLGVIVRFLIRRRRFGKIFALTVCGKQVAVCESATQQIVGEVVVSATQLGTCSGGRGRYPSVSLRVNELPEALYICAWGSRAAATGLGHPAGYVVGACEFERILTALGRK